MCASWVTPGVVAGTPPLRDKTPCLPFGGQAPSPPPHRKRPCCSTWRGGPPGGSAALVHSVGTKHHGHACGTARPKVDHRDDRPSVAWRTHLLQQPHKAQAAAHRTQKVHYDCRCLAAGGYSAAIPHQHPSKSLGVSTAAGEWRSIRCCSRTRLEGLAHVATVQTSAIPRMGHHATPTMAPCPQQPKKHHPAHTVQPP